MNYDQWAREEIKNRTKSKPSRQQVWNAALRHESKYQELRTKIENIKKRYSKYDWTNNHIVLNLLEDLNNL